MCQLCTKGSVHTSGALNGYILKSEALKNMPGSGSCMQGEGEKPQ